jgi:hypothetical protein
MDIKVKHVIFEPGKTFISRNIHHQHSIGAGAIMTRKLGAESKGQILENTPL